MGMTVASKASSASHMIFRSTHLSVVVNAGPYGKHPWDIRIGEFTANTIRVRTDTYISRHWSV